MANALYGLGRQSFGDGDIAWDTDNVKCVLVDSAFYTVSIDVDQFLSDIAGSARIATSANFTAKTNVLGVLDAADIVLSSVSGAVSEAVVIYQDSGVEATSRLIAYVDTATGLPVTPNGTDITIAWDNGANKILKL
jgi:hypothetical protein